MADRKKIAGFFTWLGVVLLQMLMTQVVTFIFSVAIPGMENFPQTQPVLMVLILGITFSIGVFLAGWLALKMRWLKTEPKYLARLIDTLLGAYLPLLAALALGAFEAGTPFFLISVLASIFGFHLPGWVARKQ